MSGSVKESLVTTTTGVETDERELALREGRKLTVSGGSEQIVEIRNEAGAVEISVKLTDQGPVLQMEGVKLSLKATESVEIESRNVSIRGTEQLSLHGGDVAVTAERELKLDAYGDVRIVGTMIYLN